MTEDEKREQKKTLLLDYEEARLHYEHLKTALYQRREGLRTIEDVLNKCGVLENYLAPAKSALEKVTASRERLRTDLDVDALCELTTDTIDAYQRLQELKERKAALGLSRG